MYRIKLIILLPLLIISSLTYSQDTAKIPVMDFESFSPLLAKDNDTTYVINFWATWCVPCRKELPEFQKIHEDLGEQKVQVWLISLDFKSQLEKTLIPYVEKNKITAPVILLSEPDANSWINKVNNQWSGSLPATFIYHREETLFFEETLDYSTILQAIHSVQQL